MVRDHNYDPKNQAQKTAEIREKKLAEISNLLSGLSYWQFRFRLWLALKYNYTRRGCVSLWLYLVYFATHGQRAGATFGGRRDVASSR